MEGVANAAASMIVIPYASYSGYREQPNSRIPSCNVKTNSRAEERGVCGRVYVERRSRVCCGAVVVVSGWRGKKREVGAGAASHTPDEC